MFKKLFNALSDFEYANTFVKEKTGRAFAYMLFCFAIIVVGILAYYFVDVKPKINEATDQAIALLETMPDFEMTPSGIVFEDGMTAGVYDKEDLVITIDLDEDSRPSFSNDGDKIAITVDENFVYLGQNTLLDYKMLTLNLDRNTLVGVFKAFDTVMAIVLVVTMVVLFIAILCLSAFSWLIVMFVNGLMKKNLSKTECYIVGIYAMTLPNFIRIFLLMTSTIIPGVFFVNMALTVFYTYKYLKHYHGEKDSISDLFE